MRTLIFIGIAALFLVPDFGIKLIMAGACFAFAFLLAAAKTAHNN